MSLGYTTKVANADCKVYVGNLGDNGDEKELTKVFSKYGKLCSVWVAQRPAGFAFIEYEDNEDAEDAVRALDGREICGQRVRVEMRKKQRRIGNERTENDLRSRERNRNRSRSPVNHHRRPRDYESRDNQYYGGRENKNRDQYNNRNRGQYNGHDYYNNDHGRNQYDNGRDGRYGGDYGNSNGGGSGSNRSYGGQNDQNQYHDQQPGRQPRISIRRVHNSPPRLTREY